MHRVKNTAWVYEKPIGPSRVTLGFSEDEVFGYSGCHSFYGRYTQTEKRLELYNLWGGGNKTCSPKRQELEDRFIRQLKEIKWATQSAEQLILSDENGLNLHFNTAPENPMENTAWVYKRAEIDGTRLLPLPDAQLTLSFDKNSASGFTGCNPFTTPYTSNPLIVFTPTPYRDLRSAINIEKITVEENACSSRLMTQEQDYLRRLKATRAARISYHTLILQYADRSTLVFTRQ